MQKGLFIVLEGGEGAGKTTQVRHLQETLPVRFPGREFVFTHEPGGSPFADQIRALILSEGGKHANGRTMLGLFVAARADHVEKVIEPALVAGKIVICDRYFGSTYAYQVVAQENPVLEELFWAHTKLMPHPDVMLLFDVDPNVALERIAKRKGEKTHFDARAVDFHERIRKGFAEYLAKAHEHKTVRIDAAAPLEEMYAAVEAAIVPLIEASSS